MIIDHTGSFTALLSNGFHLGIVNDVVVVVVVVVVFVVVYDIVVVVVVVVVDSFHEMSTSR